MNSEVDFVIETTESTNTPTVASKRFPVLAQLAVLGVVLALLLSAGFAAQFINKTPQNIASENNQTNTTQSDKGLSVINKIEGVTVEAAAAFVYDVKGKKALYVKGADKTLPLASITKLMTSLVAYELIDEKKTITVPESAVSQSGASGLIAGEKITAQSLSDYSLLASSNDAAFALAAAVGSVIDTKNPNQTFINAMNIRAKELGLENFIFYNPTGLDVDATQAGAVGTAREVTFLMEYILNNYPNILEPSTFTSTRVYNEAGTFHAAENTNPITAQIPNLLGSKTGYTDLAGGNLTIAFDAGFNRPIIITVLGSSYDGRFTDVKKLVNEVTKNLQASE